MAELDVRGIELADLKAAGISWRTFEVDTAAIEGLRFSAPHLQQTDLAVLFVAESQRPERIMTLTDDLALRVALETRHLPVAGSFGILVRAYSEGRFGRQELVRHVDQLLNQSSLHVGRGFRAYVHSLLQQVP